MRLIDADALIKEIEMDIEDVGLQEKMVFYRINEALQAEPSDGDLISRQDAIDAVASRDETNGTVKVFTGRQVNEILAELPSASVEVGEWIPCSERLPSESGRYLVTYPLFIGKDKWLDVMRFGKPSMPNTKVKGKCWYRSDDEWGDVVYDEVLAWMPLPKPYERREP